MEKPDILSDEKIDYILGSYSDAVRSQLGKILAKEIAQRQRDDTYEKMVAQIEEAKKEEGERIMTTGDGLVKAFRVDAHIFWQRVKEALKVEK